MSKFQIPGFLKVFNELILVIFQFLIIILHFIKWDFIPHIELIQINNIYNFIGLFFISISIIFMLMAIKDLGRNLSPFPRPSANSSLITSGIYKFIRHPMYYSLVLISFGVFLTNLTFYYLSLTISLALIIKFKIYLEDQYLNIKFKNYSLYKKRVRY